MVVRVVVESLRARRRRALLAALNAPTDGPTDGPVQLTTRTRPIAPELVRRQAAKAVAARWSAAALVFVLGVVSALVRDWFFVGLFPLPLMVLLIVPPMNEERWRASVRHGPDGRYLSVRTLSGIRSLDLARLARIDARSDWAWAVDAEGVTVKLRSRYARRVLMSGVDQWGLGTAPLSTAARSAILRRLWLRMLRHPVRALRDPWA